MLRLPCYLVCVSLAFAACKSADHKTSQLSHDLGKTTQDDPVERNDCRELPLKKHFPKANAYLAKLADVFFASQADTFSGVLAKNSFCFDVPFSVGGKAYPSHNLVRIGSEEFLHVSTDAEIAATLAHELAHVTRYHIFERPKPTEEVARKKWESEYLTWRRLYPPYDANETVFKLHDRELGAWELLLEGRLYNKSESFGAQLSDLYDKRYALERQETSQQGAIFLADGSQSFKDLESINEEIDKLLRSVATEGEWQLFTNHRQKVKNASMEMQEIQGDIQDLDARLYTLEAEAMGEADRWVWDEKDADEVGYELFLRAGYNYLSYTTWMDNRARVEIFEQKHGGNEGSKFSEISQYRDNLPDAPTLSIEEREEFIAKCVRSYKDGSAGTPDPQTKDGSYLPPCMRVYNIWKGEREDHAKEYAEWSKKAIVDNLPGEPTLKQVQEEIRNWKKANPNAAGERL